MIEGYYEDGKPARRPSLQFARVYRFISYLHHRERVANALKGNAKDLRCFTLNVLETLIRLNYKNSSRFELMTTYGLCIAGKLVSCDRKYLGIVVPREQPTIEIYLDNINESEPLVSISEKISRELGVSIQASKNLIESIIVAHEAEHCMTNRTLAFASHRIGYNVDFAYTSCATYLSEKLTDHTLSPVLIKTFEALGIDPSLFKTYPIVELMENIKTSDEVPRSNLDVLAEFIVNSEREYEKILKKVKDHGVRLILRWLWDMVKAFKKFDKEKEKKEDVYNFVHDVVVSALSGIGEKGVNNILYVLERDVDEFLEHVNSSKYRLIDKVCTSLKRNITKVLYFWEEGLLEDLVEFLLDIGVLESSEEPLDFEKDVEVVRRKLERVDMSVFEELKDVTPRGTVLDLKASVGRVVLASTASGTIDVYSWRVDPRDRFNIALSNDISLFTRVKEKKKVKDALILDNLSLAQSHALNPPVLRELEWRLKALSIRVTKAFVNNDAISSNSSIPFSPYVFFFANDWGDAPRVAKQLKLRWERPMALAVLIAYPQAPLPDIETLVTWKEMTKHLYLASLYSFEDLGLSRVYTYQEALKMARGEERA